MQQDLPIRLENNLLAVEFYADRPVVKELIILNRTEKCS